jgi:hypothetical protein
MCTVHFQTAYTSHHIKRANNPTSQTKRRNALLFISKATTKRLVLREKEAVQSIRDDFRLARSAH